MIEVRIDPKLIPDFEYDRACTILSASISVALSNPDLRREYEEWKSDYIKTKGGEKS